MGNLETSTFVEAMNSINLDVLLEWNEVFSVGSILDIAFFVFTLSLVLGLFLFIPLSLFYILKYILFWRTN